MDHFLDGFFQARSVAVVGATNNPIKINYRLVQNLVHLGFEGRVYPVNPKAQEICGVKGYARLEDVPERIDMVVSAVPASKTFDIVKECAAIGVTRLVIVAGGFSEGGEEGRRLHQEIAAFTREKGIRVLGPNTLSPVNSANNLVISYNHVGGVKRSGLSFAFQSGFYDPKINWLCSGFGVSKILDMGNKMDINEVDALEYFALDPDTKVIAMHVEAVRGNGRDFFNILKKVSAEKPTIILKSGRTPSGSKAAASHTGSMAQENDVIFDGMIRQTAAIRAHNQGEFFDLAKAFSFLELPAGNRLATIVLSGGEGVMATDFCEMNGLKRAEIGHETRTKLNGIFPPWEIPLNPFDAGVCMEFSMNDLNGFFEALATIPEDTNVDCGIMQMPPTPLEFASAFHDIPEEAVQPVLELFTQGLLKMKKAGKPVALWRSSMGPKEGKWVQTIESGGIPVFQSSERAIKALAAMHKFCIQKSRGLES